VLTPRQVLEALSQTTARLPALSAAARAEFQRNLGVPLPAEIEELLAYAAGLEYAPLDTVRFAGHDAFGFEAFPVSVALLPDGFGNSWVVDIHPESGAWGPVFFACHDPAVLVIQAPDLAAFLAQLFDPLQAAPRSALDAVRTDAVNRVWGDDPWLVPAPEARLLPDPIVSSFAQTLSDDFLVADLRARTIGSGFSWGRTGPYDELRRHGVELIFATKRKSPGWLRRLLRRTSEMTRLIVRGQ
jgi:hypothetical protein